MGITIFKISFREVYVRKSCLRLRLRVTVKLNFRPYIRRYTSPNENFEYSYPLNVDPDQTAPIEQSDLGLHCLSLYLTLLNNVSKNLQQTTKAGGIFR